MLEGGARVYGYRFEGYWQDVGTIQSYWEANMALLDDVPELDLYDREWLIHTRSEERAPAKIGPTAQVHRSLISHGCVINGMVVNSVLSPGVRVDVGAVVRDSIIMFDTVVRSGAVVDRAILDKEVVIGQTAIVGDGPDYDTPNRQEPGRLNDRHHRGRQAVDRAARGAAGPQRQGRRAGEVGRLREPRRQVRRHRRSPARRGEGRPPRRDRQATCTDPRERSRLTERRRRRPRRPPRRWASTVGGTLGPPEADPGRSGRLARMSIAPRASASAAGDVEAWLAELGLEPLERADREGVTSWDLVLDGRRRSALRVTLILDPALALIGWAHFAPPINDSFRKSYRLLLRWNDETPFVKFAVGEDERPLLIAEVPVESLDRASLGLAIARLLAVADRFHDPSTTWLKGGGWSIEAPPDDDGPGRGSWRATRRARRAAGARGGASVTRSSRPSSLAAARPAPVRHRPRRRACVRRLARARSRARPASPAAAANTDLTVVTNATYTVQPTPRRVHVVVAIDARNHRGETRTHKYYFDHAFLAVQPGASGFAISGAKGASVHVGSRSKDATLLRIDFGARLYGGGGRSLELTFNLVDPGKPVNRAGPGRDGPRDASRSGRSRRTGRRAAASRSTSLRGTTSRSRVATSTAERRRPTAGSRCRRSRSPSRSRTSPTSRPSARRSTRPRP